ncbi:MAG: nucleotidyltransferase domain-containing protein [Lachnospiraceae bacterium]|nr:nucleotidyltransferase domain-containing protein [Lachnospiraceae bacterium]
MFFGSYARGDFEEDSDVDIILLLNCQRADLPKYRKMLSEVSSDASLDNDVTVSLIVNDKETFYGKMDILPFYQNVQKEGVVLYDQ